MGCLPSVAGAGAGAPDEVQRRAGKKALRVDVAMTRFADVNKVNRMFRVAVLC